jgi:hypothetical protein
MIERIEARLRLARGQGAGWHVANRLPSVINGVVKNTLFLISEKKGKSPIKRLYFIHPFKAIYKIPLSLDSIR